MMVARRLWRTFLKATMTSINRTEVNNLHRALWVAISSSRCTASTAEYFFLLPNWSGERYCTVNVAVLTSIQCSMILETVGRRGIML